VARIDIKKNIIQGKIVYYGPGLCGKTTNLEYINRSSSASKELVSLATEGDRTIFFDYLPIELGKIRGINTNFKLYTVPGQVRYNLTRKMVLKNVDGVVFVADSQRLMLDSNVESLENLFSNMRELRIEPDDIPVVLQYNKRDLKDILSPEELDAALNPKREKAFLASAMTGEGVLETLQFVLNVVFKKIAAEFGGGAANKPKKQGPKTLLSHQIPPTGSDPKEKTADNKPTPPPTPVEAKKPAQKGQKAKRDSSQKIPAAEVPAPSAEKSDEDPTTRVRTLSSTKIVAAASAFGGKANTVKADTPQMQPSVDVSTSSSKEGDTGLASRSETKTTDSSAQSVATTKTVTTQAEAKKDKDSTRGADREDQKATSGGISTDAIKEIKERLDNQTKEISDTISEKFDALNRNIEQLLIGQSKCDLSIKEDLGAFISPMQSVIDDINNKLVSLTKDSALKEIKAELKDIKGILDQHSKKASDFLLTGTEITNLRGEMMRWMQETKDNATGSASTGLSGHQINNIVERFQKELPSKTEIKEIRNAIAFLVKAAKEPLKSETAADGHINEELRTALDKLDNDSFRKEIMAELSTIKESVPSKQEQEKMQSSIASLSEKLKADNRKEDLSKDATTEIVGILRELRNNFVSKEELSLFRKEVSDIYQQIREMVEQRPRTEPQAIDPVKQAGSGNEREKVAGVSQQSAVVDNKTTSEASQESEPMSVENPPSSPPQNEIAQTAEENTSDKLTEGASKKDESDQNLNDEIKAETQPDESEEDKERKSQPSELKTADETELATATREAESREDNQQQDTEGRASDESLQAEDSASSADEISGDANGRDEVVAPAEVAEESAVSAKEDDQEPERTPEEAPLQEAPAEEIKPSIKAQPPLEEDADGKNALRIARVMVSDLDLYYAKDVIEGIQTGDFHERLKNQLEEMQKTFSSRVSEEVRSRRDYLGEAIETFVEKKRKQLDAESIAASEKVA